MNDVITIGSDTMGAPSEELGQLLLGNFLRILGDKEADLLPKYIILWNGGVKVAVKESENMQFLKKLEERGVKIILCKTCVEYFDLEKLVVVGRLEGMANIQQVLLSHQVLAI